MKLWESLEQDVAQSQKNDTLVADVGPMGDEEEEKQTMSFTDSSDNDLKEALDERILEIADTDEDRLPQIPLTGSELRNLIFSKYRRTYDISFARRDLWGKTHVIRPLVLSSIS